MISTLVVYRLAEYLTVCLDIAPYAQVARRDGVPLHQARDPAGERTSYAARLAIVAIGTAAFAYKKRRVGACEFTFDRSGLVRHCRMGALEVPWRHVARVFRLSGAYLFAKADGAMPVPYRCLSARQRAELEALLRENGHGPADEAPHSP